jgi:hypothetical protein
MHRGPVGPGWLTGCRPCSRTPRAVSGAQDAAGLLAAQRLHYPQHLGQGHGEVHEPPVTHGFLLQVDSGDLKQEPVQIQKETVGVFLIEVAGPDQAGQRLAEIIRGTLVDSRQEDVDRHVSDLLAPGDHRRRPGQLEVAAQQQARDRPAGHRAPGRSRCRPLRLR